MFAHERLEWTLVDQSPSNLDPTFVITNTIFWIAYFHLSGCKRHNFFFDVLLFGSEKLYWIQLFDLTLLFNCFIRPTFHKVYLVQYCIKFRTT